VVVSEENTLSLKVERGDKTTAKDIHNFYYTIYKMAENLGFNVVVPEETNQQLISLTEKINEEK